MRHRKLKMGLLRVIFTLLLLSLAGSGVAGEMPGSAAASAAVVSMQSHGAYQLQPGDILEVSVWKETELQREILIRPDGGFTFPLAGEIDAAGKSTDEVHAILVKRLERYVPNPVVTVAVKTIGGNQIYVVGKVNRAGAFPFSTPLDVMQALSLAGGATPFAAINDIVILHRQNGQQQSIHFHYADVARGRDLSQNIQLQSGDTVVVP
jgi:polysaccharide export outer membrane protein